MIQGIRHGWHRYSLTQSPTGLRFTDDFAIDSILTRSVTVTLTPHLVVTSAQATGNEFGQEVGAQLRYEDRHARGWAVVHGTSQPRRIAIDTVLPAEAFDGHALMALLPLLEWRVGATYSLMLFDTDENSITTQTIRIAARETVTVPAGTFETYRGDLTTTQAPVRLWYTVSSPHRLIKMGDATNTIVDMLVGKASH
jgi:hypothetical protein